MTGQRAASKMMAIVLSGVLLGGCADSGGGPLHRPDVSIDRIVGAAIPALFTDDRFGAAPVLILDHVDPASILGRESLPSTIRDQIQGGPDPATGRLSQAILDAIRAALPEAGGQVQVGFVSTEPQVAEVGEFGCGPLEGGATFVRIAMLHGLAVHGDVYVVTLETWTGCATSWIAARVVWQPGGLIGGTWVVLEVIDGGGVSV